MRSLALTLCHRNIRISAAILLVSLLSRQTLAQSGSYASESANTIAQGRLEAGVFSQAKWGATPRLELGAHPIGIFILPNARAKVNWWNDSVQPEETDASLWFATLHRLSIPTPFLNLVAREGSLGLLPTDADIPFAVQIENSALISKDLSGNVLTFQGGFGVAVQTSSNLPVLDFPYLYSTLAPLYSPIALRASFALEGTISGPFDYQLIHRMNWWRPNEELTWPGGRAPWVYAQESAIRTHLRLGERHRLSLGITTSVALYPVGYRFYWLPTFDYRVVIF